MLNLQDLTLAYNELFDIKLVSNFILTGKIIGGLLIILSLYTKIFNNFGRFEALLVKEQGEKSLPYILTRGLILLALISVSTELFKVLDSIFVAIEREFTSNYTGAFNIIEIAQDPYKNQPENTDAFAATFLLNKIMFYVKALTSGQMLFGYVTSVALYLFDGLIYAIFLAERFFMLGMIKLFAPLIIAFSIFEKYNSMLYDLGKVALRWYLVIIPFFFVNIFCSFIVQNIPEAMEVIAGETGGEILFKVTRAMFYIFIIIVKFKLYKSSKQILSEIIK